MMIKEARPDPNQTKEMKLKLPVNLHIKLHSLKVIHGRQISDTVREAIEQYFARQNDLKGAQGFEVPVGAMTEEA